MAYYKVTKKQSGGGEHPAEREYLGQLIPRVSDTSLRITSSGYDGSFYPWLAFDGVDTGDFREPSHCWSAEQNDDDAWIQYEFDRVYWFNKLTIKCFSNYDSAWVGNIKVLGSNDGVTFTNIIATVTSIEITAPYQEYGMVEINLNDTNLYQYIRIQADGDAFTVYYAPSIFFDEIYVYGGVEYNTSIIKGSSAPTVSQGIDGDIFLQYGLKGALLHFDDTVTADETGAGNDWRALGETPPSLSSAQSKFGGKSVSIDGGYLQTNDTEIDSYMGTFNDNDFTISCWIYTTSGDRQTIFSGSHDCRLAMDIFFNGSSANMWMSSDGGWNIIQSDYPAGNDGIGSITINQNEWTHIAMTRKGNKVRSFVNGQLSKEVTLSSANISVYYSDDKFRIGLWGNNAMPFHGYMDEFLIVNGVCLWESAFTPPSREFVINDFNSILNAYAKVSGSWQNLIGADVRNVGN